MESPWALYFIDHGGFIEPSIPFEDWPLVIPCSREFVKRWMDAENERRRLADVISRREDG